MALKQQQNQMLSAIFTLDNANKIITNNITATQNNSYSAGLEIYQRSLLANANRALAITFATVHSFIGAKAFKQLVKSYLQAHLKVAYDWGELGENFSSFIKQQHTKSLENSAILADIAALDFACHQTERAKNVDKDLATLSLLSNKDAYQLTVNFAAGFKVLTLNYPIDTVIESIKSAHKNNRILNIEAIKQQLTHAELAESITNTYHYLIWRPNFQAQYQQVTQEEYQWLALWQSNQAQPINRQLSLGTALDKAKAYSFSIVDWLPKAIEQQLINSISIQTSD